MDGARTRDGVELPRSVQAVRARVERVLAAELAARRRELTALDPEAGVLVAEVERLVGSGGKRLRPTFCYLGYRAAGGPDGEPIVRAGAALELLHTFALVHDDLMDDSTRRRGVETTHVRFARSTGSASGGRSTAVLVGDLAAVLAESLFRRCGAPAERLAPALDRFDRMRLEMAAGQYLDLLGAGRHDLRAAERVAELKAGSYTVEGPLLIGTALGGGTTDLEHRLLDYARPLGEAFQLRDDVLDGEAPPGAADRVRDLVGEAIGALAADGLEPVARAALLALAEAVGFPGA